MVVSGQSAHASAAAGEDPHGDAAASTPWPVIEVSAAAASIRQRDGSVAALPLEQVRIGHLDGSVPWRRFRSRRDQRHLPGSYWSATTSAHVVYESRLELSRLLLADFDPGVCGIWAQPLRLTAVVDGRSRTHVPDFLLLAPGGEVTLVNVKPARRLSDPRVAELLRWPEVVVRARGWRYEVFSGAAEVLVENVRFLAGYRRRMVVSDQVVRAAAAAVRDGEQLAAVERRLAAGAAAHTARPGLLGALWDGLLVTDLTKPLSGMSILHRGG